MGSQAYAHVPYLLHDCMKNFRRMCAGMTLLQARRLCVAFSVLIFLVTFLIKQKSDVKELNSEDKCPIGHLPPKITSHPNPNHQHIPSASSGQADSFSYSLTPITKTSSVCSSSCFQLLNEYSKKDSCSSTGISEAVFINSLKLTLFSFLLFSPPNWST